MCIASGDNEDIEGLLCQCQLAKGAWIIWQLLLRSEQRFIILSYGVVGVSFHCGYWLAHPRWGYFNS